MLLSGGTQTKLWDGRPTKSVPIFSPPIPPLPKPSTSPPKLGASKTGSNTVTRNVWGPAYVDALVLRDRDTDSNGTLDERLYPLQDANWNTTGLVNTSGTIVERYTYSPFGVVTFRDASGSVLSSSAKDWNFLHQGGERIAAGNYDFRNRVYSPTLGRWLSNDPIGFNAGDLNFYRYVGNSPIDENDPIGLFRGGRPGNVILTPRPIPGSGVKPWNPTRPIVFPNPTAPRSPLPFWDPYWGFGPNISPGPIIYGPPNPSGYLIDPTTYGAPTFNPGPEPKNGNGIPPLYIGPKQQGVCGELPPGLLDCATSISKGESCGSRYYSHIKNAQDFIDNISDELIRKIIKCYNLMSELVNGKKYDAKEYNNARGRWIENLRNNPNQKPIGSIIDWTLNR